MTKTLTEQWKDGELSGGYYYVLLYGEKYPMIDHTKYNLLSHKIEWETFDSNAVEAVVEEVPSYEKYMELVSKCRQLEKRLADADKTLRFYDNKDFHYEVDGVVMGAEPAHKYFVKWNVLAREKGVKHE